MGNHHPTIAPYGAFTTQDGIIQIAVGNNTQWHAMAGAVGLDPADPQFATAGDRVQHRTELTHALQARLHARTSADWLASLAAVGVPSGEVRTLDEVYSWEQTLSQGLLVDVDHPTLGTIQLPGPPLRLENRDGTDTARQTHSAPPVLGQHDTEVGQWLDGR